MDQPYYLGTCVVAIAATAAYLYVPGERVTVSGTVATLLWAFLGLNGSDVTILDDTGSQTAAPVPEELRWIMIALSVLSLLAVVLWSIGVYPPEREGEDVAGTDRYATNGD